MPVLKNSRHERFARFLAKGLSQRQAYLQAGYETKTDAAADASGARLAAQPAVRARIEELAAAVADRSEITRAWVVEKVRGLALKAEALDQYSVAKACYELLGREVGAFTEHRKLTVRRLADMDDHELEAMLADDELVAADQIEAPEGYTH